MSGPIRPPLRIKEQDGTPNVIPVNTVKVSNGTLTDDGGATVSLTTGSGGGGTMDDFVVAGDTGVDQTIENGQTLTIKNATGGAIKTVAGATRELTIDLTNTGVTGASYTMADITVDDQGRITAASSNSVSVPSGANPTASIGATATNGSATTFMRSDAAPALETTGVTADSYTLADITVDATGRITAASDGSVSVPSGANPTASIGATATNGSATTFMRSDAAPALETTGVTAASYTNADITVDATGRITAASSGSGGSGTVTVGTYAGNNNVAYFSDTTEISNTNNISVNAVAGSLDCFGSIEAGNVKIGTDTNKNTVETSNASDLVLRTNGGTDSGTLTITDGANGNISVTPNGSGAVEISGAYTLPTAVTGTNDYVLTAQTDGTTAWAAAGGGGASAIGDLSDATTAGTRNIGMASGALDSGSFSGNNNVAVGPDAGTDVTSGSNNTLLGSAAGDSLTTGGNNVAIGRSALFNDTESNHAIAIGTQTGEYQSGDYNIALGGFAGRWHSGDYNISIGYEANDAGGNSGNGNVVIGNKTDLDDTTADRQLKIAGNDGTNTTLWIKGDSTGKLTINEAYSLPTAVTSTNNYVLTAQTDGTTAWAAAAGGGGIDFMNNGSYMASGQDQWRITNMPPYSYSNSASSQSVATSGFQFYWPFVAPATGEVTEVGLEVTSGLAENFYVGFYESSGNMPGNLIGYATIDTTSAGVKYQTTLSATTELEEGTLYFVSWSRDSSDSVSLSVWDDLPGFPTMGNTPNSTRTALTDLSSQTTPASSGPTSSVYSYTTKIPAISVVIT